MVDFKKLLGTKGIAPEINPINIFNNLDKTSSVEGLRPSQEKILNGWYEKYKNQKDVIVKLPTGQGKTLIGLLLLQSCLNEHNEPAVYLCPTTYLVTQTVEQARRFGIKTVQFDSSNELPPDYLNSKSILVTTCNKMFNGLSVFGIAGSSNENVPGAIVLDDAHKCLEIIRESFSVRINRNKKNEKDEYYENPVYTQLWKIFKPSLNSQRRGTCIDIEDEKDCFLSVPFWTWHDNIDEVTRILYENKGKDKDILFSWDLIKDNLEFCTCIISGKRIEICPRMCPINIIPSFDKASKRFFMSATLTEDSFLLKDLSIDKNSVSNPLTYGKLLYSGERLILFPTKINPSLDRNKMISWISTNFTKKGDFGVVAIVPSNQKARDWMEKGGIVTQANNLSSSIENLIESIKTKNAKKVVILVNAYDGIDLPDETCRILVLDSLPSYSSLMDEYLQYARSNSKIIRRQLAQRIEQGMGRAIRGSSDWCVEIVIGSDLTNFLSEKKKISLLSNEAQKQIEIGDELNSILQDEGGTLKNIEATINQCLTRDEGWKEYYKTEMSSIKSNELNREYLENIVSEREAEVFYQNSQIDKSLSIIDKLITDSENPDDIGWYLQLKATYLYKIDNKRSMDIQIKAFEKNSRLSRPATGITYSKLDSKKGKTRANRILEYIGKHESRSSLILDVEDILNKTEFSSDSNRFEDGMEKLGEILGFLSDRPEKRTNDGPDNLWNVYSNHYWIIECKNGVKSERLGISKSEAGQMHNSVSWFKEEYEGASYQPVFIHPAKFFEKQAHFDEAAWVIDKEHLNFLKESIKQFYISLPTNNLSEQTVLNKLSECKLDQDSLKIYIEKVERQI